MRKRSLYFFIAGIGLVAGAIGALFFIYPKQSEQTWWRLRLRAQEVWSGKELSFSGLSRLNSEDLEVLLPMDKSVVWWNLNSSAIEAAARRHPMVEYAELRRCDELSLACFRITVSERIPRYIVELGGQRWLVGVDGGFMTTLAASEGLPNLVTIRGLGDSSASPDLVRGRFDQLRTALAVIEREAGAAVRAVDFRANLEFLAELEGLPFSVLFDMSDDGGRIPLQAERLAKLLKEFNGRLDAIKRVDLAYDKQAVVQVNEVQVNEATPSPGRRAEARASKGR